MSKGRAILMVVEGEKAEPELMERALEVYGISDVDEIYTYRANIYDLYRKLQESSPNLNDLDLPLVLRGGEEEYSERWYQLSKRFSDVILVFDFDPQDHLFSVEKLESMVELFSDSTEYGKLYINYPMVESYKDLVSTPYDEEYVNRSVDLQMLRRKEYKHAVGSRSAIPQLADCNVHVFNQIIVQNTEKAALITRTEFNPRDPLRHYGPLSQKSILVAQAACLADKNIVNVLCTCLWFVVDYGPQRLTRYLSTYAS